MGRGAGYTISLKGLKLKKEINNFIFGILNGQMVCSFEIPLEEKQFPEEWSVEGSDWGIPSNSPLYGGVEIPNGKISAFIPLKDIFFPSRIFEETEKEKIQSFINLIEKRKYLDSLSEDDIEYLTKAIEKTLLDELEEDNLVQVEGVYGFGYLHKGLTETFYLGYKNLDEASDYITTDTYLIDRVSDDFSFTIYKVEITSKELAKATNDLYQEVINASWGED